MFPTSFEGSIQTKALESTEIDLVLDQIEQALKAERATGISRTGNTISFQAGVFRFVSGQNILAPVGHGDLIGAFRLPRFVRKAVGV